MAADIFTRSTLIAAVRANTGRYLPDDIDSVSLADIIVNKGLQSVKAGMHDGRAVNMARGYELVYGERLSLKGAA